MATLAASRRMDNPGCMALSEPMKRTHDIAIAGGGLNGTTLALALAQSGFDVALLDQAAKASQQTDTFDGRGYALALTDKRMFAALGIWQDIAEHAAPMLQIKVSDGKPGAGPAPFFMEFDHAEIEEGPMGYVIEDRYLRRALISACERDGRIDYRDETRVSDETALAGALEVEVDRGAALAVALLVGCDGRHSGVAERAGIKRTSWDYGQTALVCAVAHSQPHGSIAHQFFMPHGPLAILPLPGNMSSIVWAEAEAEATRIAALDDAGFLAELRPRFGDFLGEIALAGRRFSYPLGLSLAESYVAPRRALVGDAAHGLHPIAGQGLNAGLKDIAALAEVLTLARRRGEDIAQADVLERYQRWRRFDMSTLAVATDGFNRLFSNDNPALRAARDIGMGLVGAMPGLKRAFIREAAGLTGDLPRLLQGRQI